MSSHRAIPACTVPRAPNTTGTTWVRHCHMRLIATRKSPYFANFTACLLPTLPSAGQLLVSKRDVRSVGFDFPCSEDGRIPPTSPRCCPSHKPIRLMPVSPALLKLPTNVPVDEGGDLIVSISVVRRCHSSIQPATMWSTVSRPALHTRQVGLTS